jgi:hypothetical protein
LRAVERERLLIWKRMAMPVPNGQRSTDPTSEILTRDSAGVVIEGS